jgi:hypothetical protein
MRIEYQITIDEMATSQLLWLKGSDVFGATEGRGRNIMTGNKEIWSERFQ